jgi:4a-hydroxytetrahydrobiopterin dehydratase
MQNNWTEADNTLHRTITFADFKEALVFVNKVGEIAEGLQHHPDICIKDYKKVFISSTTHENGNRITTKDRDLIKAIDEIG